MLLDDDVEQVAGVLAVLRRHRKRVARAELIELVEVRWSRVVHLVRDEEPRLPRLAQHVDHARVARMHARLRVDDEQQQVGFVDRLVDLAADLDVHRHVRIVGQAAGVDEPERAAVPLGSREVAVARGARLLADDGAVSSPTMRLNSADLPTLGRPTSATTGTFMRRVAR